MKILYGQYQTQPTVTYLEGAQVPVEGVADSSRDTHSILIKLSRALPLDHFATIDQIPPNNMTTSAEPLTVTIF